MEVGGENDARGHVPPAKDTQKTSQYVPEHQIVVHLCMSRRKGVKSEQSEQGEMMRAHTTCQKRYERRVSAWLRSSNSSASMHEQEKRSEVRTKQWERGGGRGTYTLKRASRRLRRGVESPDKQHENS